MIVIKLAIFAWALLVIGIGGIIAITGGYVPYYLAFQEGYLVGPCGNPLGLCPTPESQWYGFMAGISIFTAITIGSVVLLHLDDRRNRMKASRTT